jgi:colicin import membrane protein
VQKSERPRTPRQVTGKWLALLLALLVEAAFVGVLIVSVRWQNRRPEPVTAELYAPPAKAAVTEAPPPPPPIPAPQPAPQPAPPPPPPAVAPPEPKVAKPDTRSADIALKARQEEERRKKDEAMRKEAESQARALQEAEDRRKLDEKKKLDEARVRQQRATDAMRAQAEREGETRAQADREARARAQQASKAESDWIRSIQAKVRGNVIIPPDMAGNPEAIFEVVQLPTGEIIDVQLRKSSGVRAYDDAVQRAILKSSPLPRPERAELFQRSLTLKFRPTD